MDITKKCKKRISVFNLKLFTDKLHDKYRSVFANEFKQMKIIQTKNNEGIIFYPQINKNINEGLHSKPKMNSTRLFISILPGSRENINELNMRWSK